MEPIRINDELTIPASELELEFSRSSGPGGQNVNRVETRVTLRFEVAASSSLSESQKQRILRRLAPRINKEGILRVSAQRHRTRDANRQAAAERFAELLADALKRRRPRRKTRVPASERRRRVDAKRRRAEIKRGRGRPGDHD